MEYHLYDEKNELVQDQSHDSLTSHRDSFAHPVSELESQKIDKAHFYLDANRCICRHPAAVFVVCDKLVDGKEEGGIRRCTKCPKLLLACKIIIIADGYFAAHRATCRRAW